MRAKPDEEADAMEDLLTHSIAGPIRTGDARQQRAPAAPRRPEERLRPRTRETETEEQDEPDDASEQAHNVDISA